MSLDAINEVEYSFLEEEVRPLFSWWNKLSSSYYSQEFKDRIACSQDSNDIKIGVYSGDPDLLRNVVRNPYLQVHHFKYLLRKFYGDLEQGLILANRGVPEELLHEMALAEKTTPLMSYVISHHNNSREDTQVIAALRGNQSFTEYLRGSVPIAFALGY